MHSQLILKQNNLIKYQCPRCLAWIKYEESMCYYCTATTNFKGRYPESLIKFLKKNLIPIKFKWSVKSTTKNTKDKLYRKHYYLKKIYVPYI